MTRFDHADDDVQGDADPRDREYAEEMLDALGLDEREQDALTADTGGVDDPEDLDDPAIEPSEQGRCACRWCHETFLEPARADEHLQWCAAAPERLQDDAHDHEPSIEDDEDLLEDLDPGGATPAEQQSYLIRTAPHEFRAFLKYGACGLDPYYALHSKRKRYDDWDDGGPTATYEHNGREFEVELTYNKNTPILPWDDDQFRIENVYEYRIDVSGPEDLRHYSAKVSPRWPDIETEDGVPSISNPRDLVGIDIDVQGANIHFEEYPGHIEQAMCALDVAGEYRDDADGTYYDPEHVEDWSTIVDGEYYVRVNGDESGSIYALDGPIERIAMLLADDRSGYRKRVADDTEIEGYYHVATIGSKRARQLLAGHSLGKEIKHYYVKNPDSVTGALAEPKVGVSFQNSITDRTVYWDDLDRLRRELDEVLLNVLKWAGFPTTPRHHYYVEDAVFKVEAKRRDRNLIPNPLPAIENDQEVRVLRQLENLTDSDKDVVAEVLADGGHVAPRDVAERTEWTYGTVLRSLKRLEGVLEHSYGEIAIESQHIAQQLLDKVSILRENVDRGLDQVGETLQRIVAGVEDPDNPFRRWADRYGIDVEDIDEEPWILMRMGYMPADGDELSEIVRDGLTALRQTLGAEAADESRIARWGKIECTLQSGQAVARLGFG